MKIINNSIITCLFIVCTVPQYAQKPHFSLLGNWLKSCTYSENLVDSVFVPGFPTRFNDSSYRLLLEDSVGINILPIGKTYGRFEKIHWGTKDDCFLYHEDEECPWWDNYRMTCKGNNKVDTLLLTSIYRNPDYRTVEVWLRHNYVLATLNSNLGFNFEDSKYYRYEAYKKRVIDNQKPMVCVGSLQGDSLCVKSIVYKYLQRMTQSSQMELHVIDASLSSSYHIKVFIVFYDKQTKKIKHVSFVYDYLVGKSDGT